MGQAVNAYQRIETCNYCMRMCRFACPVADASGNELFTPFSKMQGFFDIIKRSKKEHIQDLPVENFSFDQAEQPWLCIHCGLCKENCKHTIEVEKTLAGLRNYQNRHGSTLEYIESKIQRLVNNYKTDIENSREKFRKLIPSEYIATVADSDVLVPDRLALETEPEKFLAMYKLLQSKKPKLKILAEPLPSVWFYYTLGLFEKVAGIIDQMNLQTTYYIENENDFYVFTNRPDLEKQTEKPGSQYRLVYNEILTEIPEQKAIYEITGASIRLSNQPYTRSFQVKPVELVMSTEVHQPAKRLPVNPWPAFESFYPEIFKRHIDTKWQQLESEPGNIYCSDINDAITLEKYRPSGVHKTIQYLAHALSA